MSHTLISAPSSRDVHAILKRTGAQLAGKVRGADHGANRRVPRRHSYEENDSRAKPWSRIGDGSILQGIIHKETLEEIADELRMQLWREYPAAEARGRRQEREAMAAELAELETRSPADVPIGRPAALRLAIAEHDAWLTRAAGRLRRIDVDVLRGLLALLTDFATGKLFPSLASIAKSAGCHYNSVVDGLRRLRAHGIINWVRRTTRTGNAGTFAPQLEQTSNAYELAPRARMADRTRHRYLQRLAAKLRRLRPLGPPTPAPEPPIAGSALAMPLTPVRAALAGLAAALDNANT